MFCFFLIQVFVFSLVFVYNNTLEWYLLCDFRASFQKWNEAVWAEPSESTKHHSSDFWPLKTALSVHSQRPLTQYHQSLLSRHWIFRTYWISISSNWIYWCSMLNSVSETKLFNGCVTLNQTIMLKNIYHAKHILLSLVFGGFVTGAKHMIMFLQNNVLEPRFQFLSCKMSRRRRWLLFVLDRYDTKQEKPALLQHSPCLH